MTWNRLALQRWWPVRVIVLFLAFAAPCVGAEELDAVYGLRVIVPAAQREALKPAVADLQTFLNRITGQEFTLVNEPSPEADKEGVPAIVLLTTDSPLVSDTMRKRFEGVLSQEAVLLKTSDDGKRFWIVAPKQAGLLQGVYVYLEELGCRWYMAGSTWEVVPEKKDIRIKLDRLWKPAFRMRDFSGTGGHGPPFPIDPKQQGKKEWDDWQRRNHFGGEFRLSGHVGEEFNKVFKAELEAHPEYRPMLAGKRVPWSEAMKISYGNPEVVKIWTDWTVGRMRRMLAQDPEGQRSFAVSVDPSDGGGHCESPESLAIGSVSDRVAFVANASARAVAVEFPGRRVSYSAYNEQLLPPAIPLEPNVYPMVIPYAFNRTGYTADELLDLWAKKVSGFSVYTYYSITDWSLDKPDFDASSRMKSDMLNWSRRGVDGFIAESTFSNGAMGLAWFVGSRLMVDPLADAGPVVDEYFTTLFGKAQKPMREMLERWAHGYRGTEMEIGDAYVSVRDASRLAQGDPLLTARIDDFRRYVHYLRLVHEFEDTKLDTAQRTEAATILARFVWRIYPTHMVHSYRIWQLLANRWAKGAGIGEAWDLKNSSAEGWTQYYKPVTSSELDSLMKEGEAAYPPVKIERREYSERLVPYTKFVGGTPQKNGVPEMSRLVYVDGEVDMLFEARPGQTRLPFKLRLRRPMPTTNKPAPAAPTMLLVDVSDKVVTKITLHGDYEWEDVVIQAPRPGGYRIHIDGAEVTGIQAPAGVPLVLTHYHGQVLQAWKSQLYFYVPRGLTRVVLYSHTKAPMSISDPLGKPVKLSRSDKLVVFNVPLGMDGKAWSFTDETSVHDIEMINVPKYLAFFAEGLLVPQNADRPSR